MNKEQAYQLFAGKGVPEDLANMNASKLLKAIEILGDKHILKQPVQRLAQPRSF